MITKERSSTEYPLQSTWDGQPAYRWGSVSWSEKISYDDGPQYFQSHCNWKRCIHVKENYPSTPCATGLVRDTKYDKRVAFQGYMAPLTISAPDVDWTVVRAAAGNLQEKVDLNTRDRTMAYSYVVDLLPLLGPFTRASSILNKIGRWAVRHGHNLRRRPFTTVLQDVIKGDLINRFVIQTTIQDTKQILDIWNQLARTWDKIHARNVEPTTLTGYSSSMHEVGSGTDHLQYPPYPWVSGGNISYIVERGTTAKVVATLRLHYNTNKADPIKWIAAQLGISTPLESIWDKIPFSFVVDYFFRVGDAISEFSSRYTSQEGLRGTVLDVLSSWACIKAAHQKRCVAVEPWEANGIRPFEVQSYAIHGTAGSSTFVREPIDCRTESGFWDKGGFWNPQLSSVRKRTLLELGLLIGGRKFGHK